MTHNLTFVAVDVETANPKYGSICAVGIALVHNGFRTKTHAWLCRPPAGLDTFAPINMGIHKITPERVASEPRFEQLWPRVLEVIGDMPIVAHNAAFDTAAVRQACGHSGIPAPTWVYGCSKEWSRAMLALPDHKLPTVSAALNVRLGTHHEAGADATAAADITIRLAERAGAADLVALGRYAGHPLRRVSAARC